MTDGRAEGPRDLDPEDLEPAPGAEPVASFPPSPIATDADRAAHGARWGVVSGIVEQLGSMVATLVLARLLSPEDFGVVAAATLLVNLLFMVGNVGLGMALIKRRSIEEPVASTTFWAATGTGIVLAATLALCAPLLARALGQPDIAPYVVGLAPLLAITMVSNVSEARLLRELKFRWVYVADIANIAAYASVTLALAVAGAGAWSMVVGRVAGELVAGTIRLVAARWWPQWRFDWRVVREDLAFNGHFLSMQVGSFLTKNLDYWVVSRALGAAALGTYYVAFVLPTILRQRMTWLATELLMPLLARAADDPPRLERIYRTSIETICAVAIPLLTGIALTADQVIGLAFGPDWTGAVAPLRWLAIAAAVEVTAQPAHAMFLALGRAEVPSRMMVVRLGAMAVALAIASAVSEELWTIAAAVTVATAVSVVVPHATVARRHGIPARRVAGWLLPIGVADLAMAAAVVALGMAVDGAPLGLQAVVLAVAGACAYCGVLRAIDRPLTVRLADFGRRVARSRAS